MKGQTVTCVTRVGKRNTLENCAQMIVVMEWSELLIRDTLLCSRKARNQLNIDLTSHQNVISHHIASHHITPHHIRMLYHIISHHITSLHFAMKRPSAAMKRPSAEVEQSKTGINIRLASGRSHLFMVDDAITGGELRELAQEHFNTSFLRLVTAAGGMVDPTQPVCPLGSDFLGIVIQPMVAATEGAFAIFGPGSGVISGSAEWRWRQLCSPSSAQEPASHCSRLVCICCHIGRWVSRDMGKTWQGWWQLCGPRPAKECQGNSR